MIPRYDKYYTTTDCTVYGVMLLLQIFLQQTIFILNVKEIPLQCTVHWSIQNQLYTCTGTYTLKKEEQIVEVQ